MNPSPIISFETFRSERNDWKRFCRGLLLGIGLPMVALLGGLEWIAFGVGEVIPPATAAQEQAKHPDQLWATVRQDDYVRYKFARLAMERPEVLVIGHSSMNEFRAGMFRPYRFYNFSRIIWPLETYADLVRHFPEGYAPKVMIFDLNFYMFNEHFGANYPQGLPDLHPPALSAHLLSLGDMMSELLAHPQLAWRRTAHLYGQPARGAHAISTGNGFRLDGAETWTPGMMRTAGTDPKLKENRWDDDLTRDGNVMSPRLKKALEEFVAVAHEKGITLIGVQMPIYEEAVNILEQHPEENVLADFRAQVAQGYFDRLGIVFFDFLKFPRYGNDYRYFVDPRHPSEPLDAAVVMAMAADPRVQALLPDLDVKNLRSLLDADAQADQHIYLSGSER